MSSSPRDEAQPIASHLAEIGARRAGSPQEATAAAFVNAQMRRSGMGVTTTPLQVTPRRRRLYGAVALCGLLAALSTLILPLPALIFALAAAVILLIDALAGPLIPIGPTLSSQSIIGTQAIAPGDSGRPSEPRWRVVLLAPLDSPVATTGLAGLTLSAPSASLLRVSILAVVVAAALLELLRPRQGWALLAIPATIMLGLQVAAALRGPQPAAHDGGIAALTALLLAGQRLRGLRRVELWAVAVGASSLDPGGVEDLLRSYPFDPTNTLLITVEQLAAGQLACAPGPRGADQALCGRLRAAAAELAIELRPARERPALRLAQPLLRRGLPTVSLYGHAGQGAPPGPELGRQAAELIAEVVRQLEAQPAEQA